MEPFANYQTFIIVTMLTIMICAVVTALCALNISSNTRKSKDYLWKIAYKDDLKKDLD